MVDDEPQLLRAVVLNLSTRGYDVSTATTGTAAVDQAAGGAPDIVVLDLGLPDIDGLEVIRRILALRPELPVVVLSARHGSNDKVLALDLGAVDYVTKPFDMNELVARLRAAGRRSLRAPATTTAMLGSVRVDLAARLVSRTDRDPPEAVRLTPTEWRILEVLLRHPGTLVTARELLVAVHGDADHTDPSYLRGYLQQLRRKLEPQPDRPRHLLTEPGMGYRYQP